MKPSDPRLRALLVPARAAVAGIVGAGVAGGVLVIAQAWVVSGLVLAVLDGGSPWGWGAALVALLALRGMTSGAGDIAAARAATTIGTSLRRRLVTTTIARAGASGENADEVATLATRGVAAAEPYVTRYLPAVVVAAVLPPLTVVAIATQDLLSALIVVLTLPLIPVFGALVGLATRDRAEEQWRAMAALSGHFLDVVRGLPTLVVHRRARAQSARIAEVTDRYRQATLRTLRIAFASSAVLELVATLSVALVAVTIGVRLAAGSIELSTALVVLLLAPEAYWPLRRMGAEFHAAAEGAVTFAAAHDLLEARGATGRATSINRAGAPGEVLVLHRVAVTWPGRHLPAVGPVDIVLPATGVTALTGPSGCGKSTLLAAIADLVPSTGDVLSGGLTVGGPAWQAQIAWLPQQPRFIDGTIADNLRLARPDASDDTLWWSLREVALEERVRELPHGLDTTLGEDGATLSAGERARLALARIVLADRPWVLLDEPTAHLDDLTEQVIADTIVALGRRSCVLVVAHRPRLVDLADLVVALPAPDGVAATGRVPHPTPAATRPSASAAAGAVPAWEGADDASERRALLGAVALGALASASGVALTATAGWLIVQASTHPPVLTLLLAVVGVRAFGLARPVLRYAERLLGHDAALRLLARRRVEVYDALVPLVPARLGRRRGDLLTSVVDDVDSVVDRQLRVRLPLVQFTLVGATAAMIAALIEPAAGPVVVGLVATVGLAHLLVRRGARATERRLVSLRADLSRGVVDALQAAEDLRMWQRGAAAAAQLADRSEALGRVTRRTATWLTLGRLLVLLATGIAMMLMAALSVAPLAAGILSGPMLALLVLLPLALADVALPCVDAGVLAARTEAAGDRLDALERTPAAVADRPAAATPAGNEIAVRGLGARWDTDAPVTTPVTLDLAPGERVALVGASGSGKSTVAAVLLRFIDPWTGSAQLGGARLEDTDPDVVRRRVGLVDDQPHVFASTLVENVRLARPDATDAEVEDALRAACLGDWLDDLPDGLHTWLGAGHAGISGGERARLGVARSLLADHPVLVLDEPTAHLDHATAERLAAEVLAPDPGRSILWITHASAGRDLVDRTIELLAGVEGPTRSGASARGAETGRGSTLEA